MTSVLVIAGSDSSGGAGLIRDVRALNDFGVDALCAITAVTAQSNSRVSAVHHVPPDVVRAQILAALSAGHLGAIKIGMLGTRATIEAVASAFEALPRDGAGSTLPVVLDPVLVASSGGTLLDEDGRAALQELLFPYVALLTPNLPEAAALLGEYPEKPTPEDSLKGAVGYETQLLSQAHRLLARGPKAVLLKGGHAEGAECVDWLVDDRSRVHRLVAPRAPGARRGTGCALASGIAAGLARGQSLLESCEKAKQYVLGMFKS